MTRIHGGRAISDKGLDLSVNINPYGPHPELWDYLKTVRLDRYPDPHCLRLRAAVARDYHCSVENVLIGNGATELLWCAARAFLEAGSRYLVFAPSFSEFAIAAQQRAASQIALRMEAPFVLDWDRLRTEVEKERPRVISICNPNSPTGRYEDPLRIQELARTFSDCLFILDESFLSLSDHHSAWELEYPDNVLRILSLTKDHGIPGLRLGFALGTESLLSRMAAELPTWNVNSLAQEAGVFVWDQKAFLADSRRRILQDRDLFQESLSERSLSFIPTSSCFVMMEMDANVAERLWSDHEINLRSCASYGFEKYWRVAVRPEAVQKQFFTALDAVRGFL